VDRSPRFNPSVDPLPADPFGRLARRPRAFDRVGRIELLGEAATALSEGRLPALEARTFLAAALQAYLGQRGTHLPLDRFLRITQRGSHATPSAVWAARLRLIGDERHGNEEATQSRQLNTPENLP
jgi:hypothetical protein